MKKLFLTILFLSLVIIRVNASTILSNHIKENDKLSFSKTKCTWQMGFDENNYNFTKHYTIGSGGFSEYELNNVRYDTHSTVEYIVDKKLLGYNPHTLKFSYITFDGQKFNNEYLSDSELQKYFPNTKFIKISEFKNNQIVIRKRPFISEEYLLINDTNQDFYKYSLTNGKDKKQIFKCFIKVIFPTTYKYSFFGQKQSDRPVLTIKFKY